MLLNRSLSIGQRFKEIRIQQGFSQAELADGVCSKSVISHLENDRQLPSVVMLGKLADKLGVPLREIMGMQEQQMEAGFQLEMIRVYIEKQDYTHALELTDTLECHGDELLEHQKNELLACRVECQLKTKMYDLAIGQLVPFLQQQETHQTVSDEYLCDAYNKLGNAHYRLNDFEKAYSAFEQGYRVSLRLSEFGPVAARVTKNLGLTCNRVGYNEDAILYLEKAYTFFERLADLKEVANTLFDMAVTTGNAEFMNKAQHLYEGLNLVHEANLAKQYYLFHVQSKSDYYQAVEELRETAHKFVIIGDSGMGIYTYSRAGKVGLNHEDYEEASKSMELASELIEKHQDENPYFLSYFYKIRSELHIVLERYEESITDAHKASDCYAIMGMYRDSADALQIASRAHELQGNFEQSNAILTKVIELLRKAHRRNDQ